MVKTLGDAYLDVRNILRKAGMAGFQIEARELVCCALKLSRDDFHHKKDMLVFQKDADEIERLVQLRLSGTPVQYITGEWDFYGLNFIISRDTLIPRADTETLVGCGIEFMEKRSKGRVLDLCCGCGCVGIAVLKNISTAATGVFADISEPALHITRRNLARHMLTARAVTVKTDALRERDKLLAEYNLILCNPPYIPAGEMDGLDREVREEPYLALCGGEDGLDFYRAISRNYKAALLKGGALMFEVGQGQYWDVMEIMEEQGYTELRYVSDLNGVERVVIGISQ
ncbi:MAG: peptide chain release factor N(5)-glutamine methyltransferase [Clostridia bacterium]|nr:peptide chain release factor N(5)-glutamine methyltransferase [Clostridia bacterium]